MRAENMNKIAEKEKNRTQSNMNTKLKALTIYTFVYMKRILKIDQSWNEGSRAFEYFRIDAVWFFLWQRFDSEPNKQQL